jgi:hypothetical protein
MLTKIAIALKNTVICRQELVRESREEAILVAGTDMEGRLGSDEAGITHLHHSY